MAPWDEGEEEEGYGSGSEDEEDLPIVPKRSRGVIVVSDKRLVV